MEDRKRCQKKTLFSKKHKLPVVIVKQKTDILKNLPNTELQSKKNL